MLRDENAIRVSDAAAELDVARSTAHRLLAMLVYRGFAVQDESRRYLPGLGIGVSPVLDSWTNTLRMESMPYLERLRDETGETVHLTVRVSDRVRFLETVESRASLKVGDLKGAVLTAHRTASGMVSLAELRDEELALMYRSKNEGVGTYLEKREFTALMQRLVETRRAGYATNRGLAEPGVGSIGFSLRLPSGRGIAALTVASPLTRLYRLTTPEGLRHCLDAVAKIDEEIRRQGIDLQS
ncbi:helix-turn-helix domain-containing protein [Leucobacter allii]|uniref:IclR family transcriptional regulator n=1 Tax=Leucobacter allii TaxID=2932247 RepID=UPI001FD4FDF4|nr:IclR family transcriptional regulator C-terminal domain-containing protein [Leucobacter allii]UOR03438.1 helix-turn-helix domain-containing protein [Leucobacter allii]